VYSSDGFTPNPGAPTAALNARTGFGYTIGGGTEVAINERWSAKVESLVIDTGQHPPDLSAQRLRGRYQGPLHGRARRSQPQALVKRAA
jgi:opacity protein-like surface antigen